MQRTQGRPLASGKLTPTQGYLVSGGLAASSLFFYLHLHNPMTFAVASGIWVGYSLMYTPMKQMTHHNTFFGAIVGALPPFIGTFAAIGSLYSVETLLLSTYIFSWQWPHFYGILYENKHDYQKAGFVMLSNTDPSGKKALSHIKFSNSLGLLVPSLMAYTGMISPIVLPGYYFLFRKAIHAQNAFSEDPST